MNDKISAIYSWNVDYALFVHEGVTFRRTVRYKSRSGRWVTIKAGTVYNPRRWVPLALSRFDFEEVFGKLLTDNLRTMSVELATKTAFNDAAMLLHAEFTKAISDPIWQWSGGPRDIVDTGLLRASQRVTIQ